MKVLMCTSVVVLLLVAGVRAQGRPRGPGAPPFLLDIVKEIMSELCEGKEEQCRTNVRQCIRDNRPDKIEREEQLTTLKTNLAACTSEIGATDADFSSLSLENFLEQENRPPFNPEDYGVARDKITALFKCMMTKEGRLATLTTCITGST